MAKPNMTSMYMTLKEICDGMAHLHSKNIIHCDLNGKCSHLLKRLSPLLLCKLQIFHIHAVSSGFHPLHSLDIVRRVSVSSIDMFSC